MTDNILVYEPKEVESKEIPTAPVLKFSSYAFADHPPPTSDGGQQNENIQYSRRGVRRWNGNNINKKKKEENKNREQEQKNLEPENLMLLNSKRKESWDAKEVEVNFLDTPSQQKKLLLEQLARALYDYSCQLAKVDSDETTSLSTPTRRTGTDG